MNKFKITLIVSILFGSLTNLLSVDENPNKKYNQQANQELRDVFRKYENYKKILPLAMEAIRKGANPDIRGTYSLQTTLIIAILLNRFDYIKELIEKYGANTNIKNAYNETPLGIAIEGRDRDLEIASYLIEHGANVNAASKFHDPYISFNPFKIVPKFPLTPLEQIIMHFADHPHGTRSTNEFIKLIRTLLCKNAKFEENEILKYYPNYKKKLPPVILRLFDRAKELRAQKIEEATSCPMDLARIISEYAAEQIPASKEEEEDKDKEEGGGK